MKIGTQKQDFKTVSVLVVFAINDRLSLRLVWFADEIARSGSELMLEGTG